MTDSESLIILSSLILIYGSLHAEHEGKDGIALYYSILSVILLIKLL